MFTDLFTNTRPFVMRVRHLCIRLLLIPALMIFVGFVSVDDAAGQILDKVKDEVDERVEENVDEGIEKSADKAESGIKDAVKCAVGDEKCIEEAKEDGETVVLTDKEGNVKRDENGDPVTASDRDQQGTGPGGTAKQKKQGQTPGKANPNYDFKPGERTIFAEDFSDDNVGDFPRDLEFRRGSMAVVKMKGGRFLRINEGESIFRVNLPETLPERYTITFDYYTEEWTDNLYLSPLNASGETVGSNYFKVGGGELGVGGRGEKAVRSTKSSRRASKKIVPIRIMVDGSYAKAYMGKERFANIPNADLPRTKTLRFDFSRLSKNAFIGDLRIAAGGRDLYTALQEEGRVAVQDIQFDTGKATLKSSSDKTLKTVASLLTEHPDLDLIIEGHTDNQGDFKANMQLSRKRAKAVRTALVQDHGIKKSRLKTVGLGSTQPTASNDSETGRAKNRRVELVKR
jgi:outer membrane protein OmpA-like peptidoglycan-associated protein